MEKITNEIKAKIFAQYLGQKIKHDMKGSCVLSGVLINDYKEWCVWLTGKNLSGGQSIGNSYAVEDCKLNLKPLSQITDEDAIECLNVILGNTEGLDKKVLQNWIQMLKVELIDGFGSVQMHLKPYFSNVLNCYQILILKGYDVKQHLLGGKTLFECGLCIYNEK